jgi:hypothetical protein
VSNKSQFLVRLSILAVITHPVVIAVLTPYMIFAVGLNWDQWVIWAVGGIPISIVLNAVMAVWFPYIAPKVEKLVKRLVPVQEPKQS